MKKNQKILHWKKKALEKLLFLESAESAYQHQQDVSSDEKPSIFYTYPEKTSTIDEIITAVKGHAAQTLPEGEFSQKIIATTVRCLELAKKQISSASGLFVALETDWSCVDQKFSRRKFYDHYHPPRRGEDSIRTLSYFVPVHSEVEVTECFKYFDLRSIELSGKNYEFWKENGPKDILKDFKSLSRKVNPEAWSVLPFSPQNIIEILFDSFNLIHGIDRLTSNIFLTLVINDVVPLTAISDSRIVVRNIELN